jgi:hypothetical protein
MVQMRKKIFRRIKKRSAVTSGLNSLLPFLDLMLNPFFSIQ